MPDFGQKIDRKVPSIYVTLYKCRKRERDKCDLAMYALVFNQAC